MEDDYDKYQRKKLIRELKTRWRIVHDFRVATSDSNDKDIFFLLENIAFIEYLKANEKRYVYRKSNYRC